MKKAIIILKLPELLYDIQNRTYLAGRSVEGGDNIKVTDDDSEENHILRSVGKLFAECRELLYPFTQEELEDGTTILDNELKKEDLLTLDLSLPSTMAKSTVELIRHYVHEYIVCGAIAEWYMETDQQLALKWDAMREDAKYGLLASKAVRMRAVRRKMTTL